MSKYSAIEAPQSLMHTSKERLLELFEATETNNDENIYTVRGWIMDALEAKMTEAEFDKWLDLQ